MTPDIDRFRSIDNIIFDAALSRWGFRAVVCAKPMVEKEKEKAPRWVEARHKVRGFREQSAASKTVFSL